MASEWLTPTVPIPPVFTRFDDVVDRWFEDHLRGRAAADWLMYSASAFGDHGIIWLLLAMVQAGRRPTGWRRSLVRAAVGLGLESAVVNGPVKWLFRRTRPVHDGLRPLYLRTPRTSSFPSGHAAAAFFGAALLRDGDRWWPLYYAIAVVVAASRVHVKIHHASDVFGGVILGLLLGEFTRQVVPAQVLKAAGAESTRPARG
jgi:undecaprenyl-diphosphatase